MRRFLLVLGIIVLSLSALLLGACSATPTATTTTPTTTATTTPTGQQPVAVMSVSGPLTPINPGGPLILVTLQNVSSESVVSLTANLGVNRRVRPIHPMFSTLM